MSESFCYRRPATRAVLLLVLVFGVGVVSGVGLDRTLFRRPPRLLLERPAPPPVARLVERARERLDLDSAQAEQLRVLLEQRQPRLVEAWANARQGLFAQIDTTLEQVNAILAPSQRDRLDALLKLRGYRPLDQRLRKE